MSKRLVPVLCLFLALSPIMLNAQEPVQDQHNAVSLNPILILFNMYMGSYEMAFGDSLSVKASVVYTPNLFWLTQITYFDIVPEARYYFGPLLRTALGNVSIDESLARIVFPSALNGPFVGAGPVISSVTINGGSLVDGLATGEAAKAFGLGLVANAGYKYRIGDKNISFFVEPYVGLQLWTLVGGTNGWTYYDANGDAMDVPADFDDGSGRDLLSYGINVGISF